MTYILIVIVIVAVILLILKNRNPGSAAKGGQALSGPADTSQAQTIGATIIRKDICQQSNAKPQESPYFKPGQNNAQKIYGVLYFELENNKKKHFYVSEKTFQNVSEGYKGKLTFTGNHFIRFETDNNE